MAGRIVLFGATGYTGRLVAHALARRGVRPVLAGRNEETLAELSAELGGGLETHTADVARPETVRALVERGDVLVSTVGPFLRYGDAAVEAAIDAGAHYIDSTGEGAFIRRVFEDWGPRAAAAGCTLMTALGYDFVPGNLAGALALERAGAGARKVTVGYFFKGAGGSPSGGTAASAVGVLSKPGFTFEDGEIRSERSAKRVHTFDAAGKQLSGISLGGTEHFSLPRLYEGLRDVEVYLGWFGPLSRPLQVASLVGEVPGVKPAVASIASRFVKGSTGGPDEQERSKSGSRVVAEAYGEGDGPLAQVVLEGPNGYTFTGEFMAWAAQRTAAMPPAGQGALGPAEAFGLRDLEAGCAEVGLEAVT